ncbi:Zinc finger CCCH domain-containing protein 9 [Nymphaea thermarum]|nr:Zinc finger CCCH domain-containing protein 9 [Nymphaea thermarum]
MLVFWKGDGDWKRVRVLSMTEEESEVEMEVFVQGTFKTELCNKWQRSGECSYSNHCRFAHSMVEVRLIIRDPRYKTKPCRMLCGQLLSNFAATRQGSVTKFRVSTFIVFQKMRLSLEHERQRKEDTMENENG